MSGFITTMFVSSPSDCRLAYPAKPKLLLPVFTFAQSQSCMNLRMDLDVLDSKTWDLHVHPYPEFEHSRSDSGLERPKDTYQSPLQRIGEALRTQQQTRVDAKPNTPTRLPQAEPPATFEPNNLAPEHTRYPYTLLPGANLPKYASGPTNNTALGMIDTGSVVDLSARAPLQTTPYHSRVTGTSLPSLFSSNPRTRAPFKPQKSNRGTSSWQLKQYAEATLGSGSLRKAVKLPEGEDKDEWLAVNGEAQQGRARMTSLIQHHSCRLLQSDQPALWLHY
jgi:MOB kinase activator 1